MHNPRLSEASNVQLFLELLTRLLIEEQMGNSGKESVARMMMDFQQRPRLVS